MKSKILWLLNKFKTHILLTFCLIISLCFLGRIAYLNHQLNQANAQLNSQISQSNLSIGKAQTEITTSNIKVNDLSLELQKEVKELKASITKYAQLEVKYQVLQKQISNATITYDGKTIDTGCLADTFTPGYIYIATAENKLIAIKSIDGKLEDFRLNIGCSIQPNDSGKLPVSISYDMQLKIRADLIETINPTGAINHYVEVYEVNRLTGKDVGKMELTAFNVKVKDQRASHWMLFAPRLSVGPALGFRGIIPEATVSIGTNLSGYGKTNTDMDWQFVRVSLDVARKQFAVGFTPVMYNVTKLGMSPFVNNIFVGPHMSLSFNGALLFGLFIGVTL